MKVARFFLYALLIGAGALHLPAASAFADDGHMTHEKAYHLDVDDEIKITVFNEPELSGTYKLSSQGSVSMPLIGEVNLKGLDAQAAEDRIFALFADGYLVDPSISVEVINARPFYILGEVRSPGSYGYVNNMTALNAVALAGGFTYRANQKKIKIKTQGQGEEEEFESRPVDTKIMPGDIVLVEERFF